MAQRAASLSFRPRSVRWVSLSLSGKRGLPSVPPFRGEEGEPRADRAGLSLGQKTTHRPQ